MSDNGDEIRVEIYSDDEYINGQSVTPTGEPISSSSEEPLSVEAVSQEEQSVDEPIVEAQSIGDIPTPKAVEEESVRVQEVVDYIRAIDPIILEKIASVYGLKVDIYTEPVKRVLQEIGLVSATGEIPKFLKDKISGEFLIDENFKLALRKVLLDDEVELDKEYSLVTLENGKVYLLGKARYVLKQSGPELIYDAKVIGLAFELDGKLEGSGFGVYDEYGQHTLYTDRLNVYDVVRIGDFGNQNFHGKSVVGKALVSDVAYMKGYFIISKDSIIDEQKGYTISDLLSHVNINSQNIGDANSNISAINNDLQNALQDIDTISSNISQLSGVVNSIIDDGLIDVKEKRTLRITWNKLVNDKDIAKSNAEYFNIIEEKDDMLNAFYNLAYYLNNNQSYTVGYPYIINDDNINTPTTIDRTTYENSFNDFWDKLNILLDAIRVAINTSVNNVYQFAVGVNNYAISVNNELQLTKNTVSEISSDAYVTKSEKRELERILNEITADYNSDINHAQSYSIDTTSYTQAYDDLASYLLTIINDTNDTTAITREDFDTKFDTYITERKNVIGQINLTLKTTVDDLSDISAELMVNMSLIPLQAGEVIAKMNELLEDGTVSQSEANVLQTISYNITKDYNTIETHLEILGQLGSQTFTDYTNAFNDIQDKLNTILTYLSQNPASDYVFSVQNDITVQELKDSIDFYYTKKKDAYGLIPFTLEYGLQDVQSTVQDAIQQAQEAIEDIEAMANDNIISRAEKKSLNREWTTIVNEVDVYKNFAIANGISSSDYETAYINLGTFLNTNAPWTPGTTPNILYDTDNDSDITSLIYSSKSGGEALIEVFKDYYNSKIVLLNTIAYIANSAVRDIANDSVLTPSEKIALRTEWDRIVSEKTSLRSHSESVGVSVTDYDNAFTTLAKYLNGGNTWSSGYPLWIDDNNYQDNTTIERTVFNSNINQYYYEANALRIAINNNVFSRLDDITSDNVLDASEKPSQRLEWETIEAERAGINAQADVYGITTEKTNYNNSFQTLADYLNGGTTWSSGVPLWLNDSNIGINTNIVGSTYRTNWRNFYTAKTALLNAIYDKAKQLADAAQTAASNAQATANAAQTAASDAQTSANTANALLSDIASDSRLTPIEKQSTKLEWDTIADEYAKITAQADMYASASSDKANYVNAYNALSAYITPLLSDLNTTSTITGTEFRAKFSDYYSKRQTLLNRVAEEAQKLAKSGGSLINWQNLEYCNYPMTIASYQNFATHYYGNATENAIIHADTPYGTMDKVWECNCDAADNGNAGGFKTGYFPVNPSKNYIYGAWVKLLDSGNIYIYFGPDDGAGVVKLLDGTDISNPYFVSGLIQSYLPTNRWLLFIGVIHNKDYSASRYSANLTGVYDPLTLKKLPERSSENLYREFKWYGSTVTSTRLRLFRTYAGTAGTKMQIYGAFVYELSGTIPTVYDMLMTAVRIPPTARPSDSGTFAYYTFDKSLTSDDSFNGKTLSTSGTVSLVASDIKGKCAYFDNSGYLYRDDSAIKTDQMTYTFWFKWNGYISGKTTYGLFARAFYVRCYLYYTSNYVYLYYAVRNSAGTHVPLTAYRIEPSKWYHVAASYDKTTGDMKLYVNGSRVGVANSGAFTEHSNNRLTIGTDNNNASVYQFNGYIDEFRAYSRILSDDEVMYMYLNPTVGLDYGSLKTIIDGGLVSSGTIQVGQGNDGDYTVKAGITGEGTDETSVRMWAGATFANRNNAPFRVLQNGEMHASAGYIAGWKILTDRFEKENGLNKFIINPADQSIKFIYDGDYKVAIQNAALPMLSELVNPNANQFSLGIYQEVTDYVEVVQGFWEASGSILSSSSFAIPNSSYKVAIGFYISQRMSIQGQLWLTDNAGTKIELIGYVSFSAGIELYVTRYYISSPKSRVSGTYRVLFEYEINGNGNYRLVTIGYGGTSNNYFSYTQALNGSIIGNNGITTFWGNSKYMHISSAESYFMQVFGNGILTGSGGSGIQFDGTGVRLFGIQHDNQYNYQNISSSHVVLNFNSKTIIVYFGSSSYYAILPTLSSIQTAMKLGAGVPFSFMYRIIGNASSVSSRVYGRNTTTGHSTSQYPTLRNNNGANAVYVALGAGDTLILELVYDGTDYNAYMLSYRT